MMGLGLGLGWGLDLGFVNNDFIDIVACWMDQGFLFAANIVAFDEAIVDAMTF